MLTQSADTVTVESFPGSPLQRATRLLRPSAAVRIAARLRRGALDRGLGDGAEPDASVLTAARAAQLSSASARTRIADGLERLARSAERPRSRARILPSRAAMLANRSALLEIADTLRRDRPLYARGVAMLELILTDGAGPAYTDRRGEVLAGQLEIARARLTS
jgi:hypothetical protein